MSIGRPRHTSPARRRRRVTAALVATVGLAAGCTSAGTAITQPFTTTPPRLEHGSTYEVKVMNVSGLGPVLVDGQGITLYQFATDHQGSPSRCYGICEIQWPPDLLPVGVAAPVAGPGIEAGLLGTAPRTDGTTQITYNGWPLYFWPPDRAPGKATGQALTNAGGRWYVLNPEGDPVKTPGG
jgi:predicted lipoprotein with Yx(FWY)xxD motif